eukprot:3671039-Pyramimonas_sp.AAC.1
MAACATPLAVGEGRRREILRAIKTHLRLMIHQRKMFPKNTCRTTRTFGGNKHGLEALLHETGYPPAQP